VSGLIGFLESLHRFRFDVCSFKVGGSRLTTDSDRSLKLLFRWGIDGGLGGHTYEAVTFVVSLVVSTISICSPARKVTFVSGRSRGVRVRIIIANIDTLVAYCTTRASRGT